MKAAHMTVKRDGFMFQNGESYLVVKTDDGEHLVDMVEWLKPHVKNRPTTQSEMDAAVYGWFEHRHDDVVNEMVKGHICDERATMRSQPHHVGKSQIMNAMIDFVNPEHVEIEIAADGKTMYVHVNGVTAFRAGRVGKLVVNDHRGIKDAAPEVCPDCFDTNPHHCTNRAYHDGIETADIERDRSEERANAELLREETAQLAQGLIEDRELSFDEAEAAGFNGAGTDGDPRFPYHVSDAKSPMTRYVATPENVAEARRSGEL